MNNNPNDISGNNGSNFSNDKNLHPFWLETSDCPTFFIAENQHQKRKTGGGSPPPPVPDFSEKVSSIIPSQMKPLENDFDCDKWITEQQRCRNRDARSALIDWEYEEHKLRLKTLVLAHEAEQLRVEKAKLEIRHITEKHELDVKLLISKLEIDGGTTILVDLKSRPEPEFLPATCDASSPISSTSSSISSVRSLS
ncbi:hypothetical protein Fcan01_24418 [Folsomia candida]|uniref:Uncharacterized protein n=1 Tax=Folsomia candida TaxID=158441 RepID=A0A226D766_FOLCA|nr:hypothetical protein Fcan01_24418 [Folsomia candida]